MFGKRYGAQPLVLKQSDARLAQRLVRPELDVTSRRAVGQFIPRQPRSVLRNKDRPRVLERLVATVTFHFFRRGTLIFPDPLDASDPSVLHYSFQ